MDADAFFDFDGGASYMDLTEPALDLGSLVGVSSGDITFVFDEPHSTFLTIQFAPGSFESGDSFRFAADTDNLVSDPAPGSVFGEAGATFTVTMEGGATSVGTFAVVSPTQSTVIPEFGGCLTILSQEVVCHADGTTFTFNAEGLNSC
ncbi:MAG: hypothetical protein GTO30_09430, partial [Acidobacteria bacterium]|nr:hypothetical protein [Acidobacteriota bacterium]NIQ86854.1 hypothetical protein [Acidobacteriota bacterium]